MRWILAVLGLAVSMSVPTSLAQETTKKPCDLVVSADDASAKALKAQCIALRDELALQKAKYEKLLAPAAIASIDGMTVANICRVMDEVRVILRPEAAPQNYDPNKCNSNVMTDALVDDIKKFQATIIKSETSEEQKEVWDGWLKSDQYVELVCLGVRNKKADSMRYAAWMFLTGQGLPKDRQRAKFLAQRAFDRLDELATTKPEYRSPRDNAQEILNRLKGVPAWNGDVENVCSPPIAGIRADANLRRKAAPTLVASFPKPDVQQLRYDTGDQQ